MELLIPRRKLRDREGEESGTKPWGSPTFLWFKARDDGKGYKNKKW